MKTSALVCLCAIFVMASGCDNAVKEIVRDRADRRRMKAAEQLEAKETVQRERLAAEEKARQERETTERLEFEKGESEKLMATLPALARDRIKLLKEKRDELTDTLKDVAEDRRRAGAALALSEDRRGLEYTVYNVMTNQELNALAVKYTGSDFNALRSEFTEAIRFHKASRTELKQTLEKNAAEYQKQIKDVDKGVDEANRTAQNAVNTAHANIERRIKEIDKQRDELVKAKVKAGDPRMKTLDMQLERLEQLLELSGGSTAHMSATVRETAARKRFDRALEEKESKDTAAISESQFKGDLYNAAQIYRGRSFDRLQNAMTAQAAVLSERLFALEETLAVLEESAARMRLMEYADLVKLRDTIMSDARTKLGDALTAPVRGM